jgi:S-(hydroxymethyl)glutathione synthase
VGRVHHQGAVLVPGDRNRGHRSQPQEQVLNAGAGQPARRPRRRLPGSFRLHCAPSGCGASSPTFYGLDFIHTELSPQSGCKGCGVHLYGRIENRNHPKGALFSVVAVVPRDKVSVVENGDKLAIVDPGAAIQRCATRRLLRRSYRRSSSRAPIPPISWRCAALRELGLAPYDCLSPELMDAIATHVAKASGALKA